MKRSKLFKVEIMSDDDIAGTYDIAANGALTLASGGSKTITVTTGSGFAIDNATEDMSKNATYAVVAPGTHTFRIRYWLRNTTDNPEGTIEGTVSKIITLNCAAGSIQDIPLILIHVITTVTITICGTHSSNTGRVTNGQRTWEQA